MNLCLVCDVYIRDREAMMIDVDVGPFISVRSRLSLLPKLREEPLSRRSSITGRVDSVLSLNLISSCVT